MDGEGRLTGGREGWSEGWLVAGREGGREGGSWVGRQDVVERDGFFAGGRDGCRVAHEREKVKWRGAHMGGRLDGIRGDLLDLR